MSMISRKELERGEFVAANLDSIVDPEERSEREELSALVTLALNSLGPKEQLVIRKRYPKEGTPALFYRIIGHEEGVSSVRIQQIEGKAMRKLRYPDRIKKLGNYRETNPPKISRIDTAAYINGIFNALHNEDFDRAVFNLALIKCCFFESKTLFQEEITLEKRLALARMLADPKYLRTPNKILIEYLSRFFKYPDVILKNAQRLDQWLDGTSQQKELSELEEMINRSAGRSYQPATSKGRRLLSRPF